MPFRAAAVEAQNKEIEIPTIGLIGSYGKKSIVFSSLLLAAFFILLFIKIPMTLDVQGTIENVCEKCDQNKSSGNHPSNIGIKALISTEASKHISVSQIVEVRESDSRIYDGWMRGTVYSIGSQSITKERSANKLDLLYLTNEQYLSKYVIVKIAVDQNTGGEKKQLVEMNLDPPISKFKVRLNDKYVWKWLISW